MYPLCFDEKKSCVLTKKKFLCLEFWRENLGRKILEIKNNNRSESKWHISCLIKLLNIKRRVYTKEFEHLIFWNQFKTTFPEMNIQYITLKKAKSSKLNYFKFGHSIWYSRYVYVFCVDLEYRCGKNSQKRTIIE